MFWLFAEVFGEIFNVYFHKLKILIFLNLCVQGIHVSGFEK